jgi:hypothetical protein
MTGAEVRLPKIFDFAGYKGSHDHLWRSKKNPQRALAETIHDATLGLTPAGLYLCYSGWPAAFMVQALKPSTLHGDQSQQLVFAQRLTASHAVVRHGVVCLTGWQAVGRQLFVWQPMKAAAAKTKNNVFTWQGSA